MWVLFVASNLIFDHPFCLAPMLFWECHTFDSGGNKLVPITTSTVMTHFILTAITAFAHVLLPMLHAPFSPWLQLYTRSSQCATMRQSDLEVRCRWYSSNDHRLENSPPHLTYLNNCTHLTFIGL